MNIAHLPPAYSASTIATESFVRDAVSQLNTKINAKADASALTGFATSAQGAKADSAVQPATMATAVAKYLPLAGGTMTGDINAGAKKITNLATPTAATDSATKGYVDSAVTSNDAGTWETLGISFTSNGGGNVSVRLNRKLGLVSIALGSSMGTGLTSKVTGGAIHLFTITWPNGFAPTRSFRMPAFVESGGASCLLSISANGQVHLFVLETGSALPLNIVGDSVLPIY